MCATCGCAGDTHPKVSSFDPAPEHHHHHHDHPHDHHHPHDHRDGLREEPAAPGAVSRTLTLEQDVLAKNNLIAERNRGWLDAKGIVAWNLMSSPGAGKTTLLERTIRDLGEMLPIAVIEGDQETALDAERIRATGCRVVQINTGSGCHLDAAMVAAALRQMDPPPSSLLMIENVGNLVCPALFDLGERGKVVIMSVTEGEDKPLKYAHMFRASQVMVLTKIDLLAHLRFDVDRCLDYARRVNPRLSILPLSATNGDGLKDWYGWLRESMASTPPRE